MGDVRAHQTRYDMAVVRGFALSALVWGAVGMLVGLLAAAQPAWPELSWGPYLHFGRIRPIHTNAVIFGFTLGVVFAGSYYAVQRLCRVRMFSDTLSRINLWGWNAIIVAAAVFLAFGKTSSKEQRGRRPARGGRRAPAAPRRRRHEPLLPVVTANAVRLLRWRSRS